MATILLVDDCERERQQIAMVLQTAGHHVAQAGNGPDGLAKLSTDAPDLVITDIFMPSMDGFEFIRQMREWPETENTRVILYTAAYDQRATLILAANCTAITILPKPAEPEFLIRSVESALGQTSEESPALGVRLRSARLELAATQLRRKMAEVERVNAELRKMNKTLENSNEALRQFAYQAAHHLQEPLRSVVNAADMLARQCVDGIGKKSAAYLMECAGEARQIYDMITDLLARLIVVEDSEVSLILTDSNEVAREVISKLSVAIIESGADVECGHLPPLHIQRTHLSRLLQNLVGNAVKYRRQSVPPVIRISAARQGDLWRFQVQDNGIGFNPDHGNRIFKILGSEDYPGMGVGLAMCARIVAHYQGQIWAEGRPGEGAVFSFTLPAAWHDRAQQPN